MTFNLKFNLRFNATQLRILVLVVNLLMALGVPSFALYGFFGSSHSESVEIVDVEKLKMRKEEVTVGPSAVQRISIVPNWLIQKVESGPIDKATVVGTGKPPEQPTKEDGALDPGPLGESWDYVFYILRGDPLDNLVTLKKKDPNAAPGGAPGSGPGSTRSNTRLSTRTPIRTSKVGTARKIGPAQPSDRISFLVSDRRYKNDDLALNFYIHSADEKEFVYWVEETGPNKKFSLKFVKPGSYLAGPEEGLRPLPVEKPEDGSLTPEESVEKHFRKVPINYESQKEKEYDEMLKGAKAGPVLSTEPSAGGTAADAGKPAPAPGGGAPGAAGAPPGPGVRKAPTEAEKKQLQDALRKIPAKDQQEIEKALKGGQK
jgi:hypothetical protein